VTSIRPTHLTNLTSSCPLALFLQPYLPQGGISASPYSEGGALYALGLIHASKGGAGNQATISYLKEALR
jgi:hypothetical protein